MSQSEVVLFWYSHLIYYYAIITTEGKKERKLCRLENMFMM